MIWTDLTKLISENLMSTIAAGLILLMVLIIIIKKSKAKKVTLSSPYSFQDLKEDLKKADGMTPELIEKSHSFGVEYLKDFVNLFPLLNDSTARDLTDLVNEEKWIRAYIDNVKKNKEFSLVLISEAWLIFPDKDILPELVELLAQKDESIRMGAVDIISAINDKSILPYLVAALLQPEKYLPARVAEALVNFGSISAGLLLDILPSLPAEDKVYVLETLGQIAQDYPIENVTACLKDSNEAVRLKAATALGESLKYQAGEDLLIATGDDNWQVRSAAIKSLGQLLYLPALSRAEAMLEDEAFGVRANAQEAVRRLKPLVKNAIGGQ